MGCVYAYVIVLTFVGPEYLRRSFDVAHDSDVAEAVGHNPIGNTHKREAMGMGIGKGDAEDLEEVEKGHAHGRERT